MNIDELKQYHLMLCEFTYSNKFTSGMVYIHNDKIFLFQNIFAGICPSFDREIPLKFGYKCSVLIDEYYSNYLSKFEILPIL